MIEGCLCLICKKIVRYLINMYGKLCFKIKVNAGDVFSILRWCLTLVVKAGTQGGLQPPKCQGVGYVSHLLCF